MESSKVFTLSGNLVHLRQPLPSDYPALGVVLNDLTTMQHLIPYFGRSQWTQEEVRERYEYYANLMQKGEGLMLAVEYKAENRVVGNCGFRTIDPKKREAEFGLILHQSVWGKGVALECHLLCLKHGFEKLGLQQVYFVTDPPNKRMQGFFQKMQIPFTGMTPEGCLRYDLSSNLWPKLEPLFKKLN